MRYGCDNLRGSGILPRQKPAKPTSAAASALHKVAAGCRSHKGVWQPGYFDRALRAEEDVREVARYIVANPLRAGLCRQIGDYPLWDALWL
jgi:hypothetical protein